MTDTDIYFRWYNERLNVDYYPDLIVGVADCTNIQLRRTNNRIGNAYQDISSKLEIIGYHVHSIKSRLELGVKLLPKMLKDLENDISTDYGIRQKAAIENNRWIEFYDYVLASHIEGALIQSKALLDSFAQLYSLAFGRNVKTFSKYGKTLLNDINRLNDEYNNYKQELTKFILKEKDSWIEDTIKNRDIVVHYGQLRKFRCPMIKLDSRTKYEPDEIVEATMPNGITVLNFSDNLLKDTHRFSKYLVKVLFDKLTNDARASALPPLKRIPPRNSLCPCGSGDKYKDCHGKLA